MTDNGAAFDCHRDCDAPAALVAAAVAGAADVAGVPPTRSDRSDCDDSVRGTVVARSDSIPRYEKKHNNEEAIYICKYHLLVIVVPSTMLTFIECVDMLGGRGAGRASR